ncbi:MAG: transcriptional regulator [Prosthecochloris sp.]|nr:transcriptional regulator [Prosthecochloris sp.]
MTHDPAPDLHITENPAWVFLHPEGIYTTRVRLIGSTILHFSIEADRPVTLELFEKELLLKVLHDSGLDNDRKFYVIWNLDLVRDFSHSYKKGIAEILLNTKPNLPLAVFYNIRPELQVTVDTLQAIMPDYIHLATAETRDEAVRTVTSFLSGTISAPEPPADPMTVSKNCFLAATARIGWLSLYNQPIYAPYKNHPASAYLAALEDLQKDLEEKKNAHRKQLAAALRKKQDLLNARNRLLDLQEEKKVQLKKQADDERQHMQKTIAAKSKEIERAASAVGEKRGQIRDLYAQVSHSGIPDAMRKKLLATCEHLIETELNEKKIDLVLTSNDSRFLTRLQEKHPDLNKRELKICLMIKLSFDTRDIATTLGISRRGMESIRYRMHKKIGLNRHQSIKNYLNSIMETSE